MRIVPIFAEGQDIFHCPLWAVCYPEDQHSEVDEPYNVFDKLFDLWNDTQWLAGFFKEHYDDLCQPFWKGISISDAIDKVRKEANDFEDNLLDIIEKKPGYEHLSVLDLFEPYHEQEFYLKIKSEQQFRKGRVPIPPQFLRLYGIEFPERKLLITGGAIKLTRHNDRPHLEHEQIQLQRIQSIITGNHIITIEDFFTDEL